MCRSLAGGGRLLFAEAVAPHAVFEHLASVRHRSQYICDLEEIARAAPYFAPELFTDALPIEDSFVLLFAVDTAANCGAINGHSASESMGRVVCALHLRWARMRITQWVEFVKSEAS